MQVLARIQSLKREQLWREADDTINEEFRRLVGAGTQALIQMSETELLAKILQAGPTQAVHLKGQLLTTLFREAGDVATGRNELQEARACYLKGLDLLLETLAQFEPLDFPDFVPKVESFLASLEGTSLPLSTQARLMQHYERTGAFGKAEDFLYAMLDAQPSERNLLDFGIAFYHRLEGKSDASLNDGNLPRPELDAALDELERRKARLAQT